MRLNVGGARARRWLYLPTDRGGTFVSCVVGGPDMYKDDMEASFRFPVEGRNGLWNGIGTSGWGPWKEVLAAPWVGTGS